MRLSKAFVLPVASAALVLVGAGAVLAGTAPSASTGTAVAATASSSPAATPSSKPVAPYLRSVLDPLVANGTITSAQEQAIVTAWVAKRDELKAERQQLRKFLSDGVLTADELAQLPADSPFQQLKPLMTNGRITVAQIRALGVDIIRDLRGVGMGPKPNQLRGFVGGTLPAPAASPAVGG